MNGHVQRMNPLETEHKEALAKYLADRNKVTECVPVVSPRRRRRPVKAVGFGPTGRPDDERRREEARQQLADYCEKVRKTEPCWPDAVDGKTGRKRK